MGWVEHAVWWHVYPLGFTGSPIRDHDAAPTASRLRRLLDWLDYSVEMGASGLLLGPIFASGTHGYDTVDHFAVDPRLGGESDFDEVIHACKAKGLRVLLDGVFSHVGASHPDLTRALREGPDTETARLFDIDWDSPGGATPRIFEGHAELCRFDHSDPSAVSYVARVMDHWLGRGVDGWRLDAAYSVPVEFWHAVLPVVRERHPGAWFVGEVIHGDYPGLVKASGMDSVTQYELWKAIWSSLVDRNMFELDWALSRHNSFLRSFVPQTFIGNHDVSRIASVVGQKHAITALAILMTVGGIPSIYSGDEQGFLGIKEERVGGDDEIRPAFPDDPRELAPWGRHVFRAHQDLIGLRRRHPWLLRAETETLLLDNRRYIYRSTAPTRSEFLEVDIDLDRAAPVIIRGPHGDAWSHGH